MGNIISYYVKKKKKGGNTEYGIENTKEFILAIMAFHICVALFLCLLFALFCLGYYDKNNKMKDGDNKERN